MVLTINLTNEELTHFTACMDMLETMSETETNVLFEKIIANNMVNPNTYEILKKYQKDDYSQGQFFSILLDILSAITQEQITPSSFEEEEEDDNNYEQDVIYDNGYHDGYDDGFDAGYAQCQQEHIEQKEGE